MRVVSVLPSATEIVYALGHGSELLARSAECDFPADAQRLPVAMRPRTWDADQPSAAIDARVRAERGHGRSLYALDLDVLRRARPDLLLTQDLCGVCSVTGPEVESACAEAGIAPRVVSLTPRRLEEVWGSIEIVAGALGDEPAGARLAHSLRRRSGSSPETAEPRVAVVEWLDPPILSGLWTPDIVRAAGGRSIGPESGEVGERTDWGRIARAEPDLLVVSPCSFSVARTRRELQDRAIADGVGSVGAPRGTFLADEAYFSRPGPRLADGVELLRTLLSGSAASFPMPVARWSAMREGATA